MKNNNKPQLLLKSGNFWDKHHFNNPTPIDKSIEKLKLIERETKTLIEIRDLENKLSSAKNIVSAIDERIFYLDSYDNFILKMYS